MFFERYQRPVHEAQALPDAIAKHEAAVEHRYHRAIPGHEFAIDVNQDVVVTGVVNVTLRARLWESLGWFHELLA